MTNTLIVGVLTGVVLLGVFGAIVPLILVSALTFGAGALLLRRGRRLSSRRHTAKRLKG